MYTGFNLQIDETAGIFDGIDEYQRLQERGKEHLNIQKADYEKDLKKYVEQNELDGTKIQNEWFPQVNADIFISHSHKDKDLACALAGWINEKFGLNCFIDSNVWGYSQELLDEMNSRLSNRRKGDKDDFLYDYESCNKVSQHVNIMLSIALQKMIDKVEAVIVLNTDNVVRVCSDTKMEKTYSPWIYSEIICTQLIRKKPLFVYRNYQLGYKENVPTFESLLFLKQIDISYSVSLRHLNILREDELIKWEGKYSSDCLKYENALDALYEFKCPDEVKNTKKMFAELGDKINSLKRAYSAQGIDTDGGEGELCDVDDILSSCLICCYECGRCRICKNDRYQ